MALEIERKYLVRELDGARLAEAAAEQREIEQIYLSSSDQGSARVRRSSWPDGRVEYTHTTKRRLSSRSREEMERVVDAGEYARLVRDRDPSRTTIRKRRYAVPLAAGLVCEIDVFAGELAGLVLAEVELPAEDARFQLPRWLEIEREVTDDPAYANAALARRAAPG